MPKYIGTISRKYWNEDAVKCVFRALDGRELYLGRESGRNGYEHYQFCLDCAGDLCEYNNKNSCGWHIELCVSWEDSKNYCRKTNNYLYVGDSIEERYYKSIRSKTPLRIWKLIGATLGSQNDRSIDVWIDRKGSAGKSTFAYLLERRGKCLTIPRVEQSAVRIVDYVAMHYDNEPIILVDIPRDDSVSKSLCKALEDLKDGKLSSAKYQGCKRFIKGVKILVFTNNWIDPKVYRSLSEDRWRIKDIAKALKSFSESPSR